MGPRTTQNSWPTARVLRSSSHGSRCDQAHRSIPTSRRLSPLPWRISTAPRSASRSVSLSASASLIRSPRATARRSRHAAGRRLGCCQRRADSDDLVHGRRIRRVAETLVARRHAPVKAGRGRWRPAPAGAIEEWYGLHDVLLCTTIDRTIVALAPRIRYRHGVGCRRRVDWRPASAPASTARSDIVVSA
jgi:hypothetical protein